VTEREVLTPEQAAAVAHLTRRTIYEALRDGRLRGFKPDGVDRWRIYGEDLHTWLRSTSSGGTPSRQRRRSPRGPKDGSLRALLDRREEAA